MFGLISLALLLEDSPQTSFHIVVVLCPLLRRCLVWLGLMPLAHASDLESKIGLADAAEKYEGY